MIELFTSDADGAWAVRWQEYDDFGALVDEGIVAGSVASDRERVDRVLRAVWTDLLVAQIQFDKVGAALRVQASRRHFEATTGRQLLPFARSAVL